MNWIYLYLLLAFVAAAAVLALAAVLFYSRPKARMGFRQATGSRIALNVGDLFSPSDRFAGFVHQESGASIVTMELPPLAFDRFLKHETAEESFAAQGLEGVAQLTLPNRIGEYIYLRGEQNTALVEYVKYILIFRDGGMTGMVTANIPRAAIASGIVTGTEIETILASAAVRDDTLETPRLFTLAYLGPFEEDLSLLGTTKAYRLKSMERAEFAGPPQPLFLVAPALAQAPIPNLSRLAERTFNDIDQVRDKTIETIHPIEIAGLHAVEAYGRGVDAGSGAPALVYQLVVEARHGGYFRLMGLAPGESRDRFLREFRQMAGSFRPAG
jgi:hypothetical protein